MGSLKTNKTELPLDLITTKPTGRRAKSRQPGLSYVLSSVASQWEEKPHPGGRLPCRVLWEEGRADKPRQPPLARRATYPCAGCGWHSQRSTLALRPAQESQAPAPRPTLALLAQSSVHGRYPSCAHRHSHPRRRRRVGQRDRLSHRPRRRSPPHRPCPRSPSEERHDSSGSWPPPRRSPPARSRRACSCACRDDVAHAGRNEASLTTNK